jgi:hypothetical protein
MLLPFTSRWTICGMQPWWRNSSVLAAANAILRRNLHVVVPSAVMFSLASLPLLSFHFFFDGHRGGQKCPHLNFSIYISNLTQNGHKEVYTRGGNRVLEGRKHISGRLPADSVARPPSPPPGLQAAAHTRSERPRGTMCRCSNLQWSERLAANPAGGYVICRSPCTPIRRFLGVLLSSNQSGEPD